MPPLASTVVDAQTVFLLGHWITRDLPYAPVLSGMAGGAFGSTNAVDAGADEDFDVDGDSAYPEFLNQTDPKLKASHCRPLSHGMVTNFYVQFERTANRGYELQRTDLQTQPSLWTALDLPANAPTFSSTNTLWVVPPARNGRSAIPPGSGV